MAASTKRPAKTSIRHCSVPFSTNNDRKDVERKLSFFTFPADTGIRKAVDLEIRRDEGTEFKVLSNQLRLH